MRILIAILTTVLMLAIAGCSEESETASEPKAEETTTTETQPAAEPAKPEPAQEAKTAPDTQTVTNDACVAAVRTETSESDVTVTDNAFSEANTIVMLAVGAQKAPWKCLVSNDGVVEEASFQGDDGAGVAEQEPSSSDVSGAATDACLKAVSGETSESDVAVLSSEFSEANSMVTIGVGAARAPWRCLVSNDGAVQDVSSLADEGND